MRILTPGPEGGPPINISYSDMYPALSLTFVLVTGQKYKTNEITYCPQRNDRMPCRERHHGHHNKCLLCLK